MDGINYTRRQEFLQLVEQLAVHIEDPTKRGHFLDMAREYAGETKDNSAALHEMRQLLKKCQDVLEKCESLADECTEARDDARTLYEECEDLLREVEEE